jgi:YmgG-like glycine-zipper protein
MVRVPDHVSMVRRLQLRIRREDLSMKTLISSAVGMSMLAMALSGCGTAAGTAVGAGAGAAVGAGTGYGAGKGALIGAGVGAVGGAIYDITKKN